MIINFISKGLFCLYLLFHGMKLFPDKKKINLIFLNSLFSNANEEQIKIFVAIIIVLSVLLIIFSNKILKVFIILPIFSLIILTINEIPLDEKMSAHDFNFLLILLSIVLMFYNENDEKKHNKNCFYDEKKIKEIKENLKATHVYSQRLNLKDD